MKPNVGADLGYIHCIVGSTQNLLANLQSYPLLTMFVVTIPYYDFLPFHPIRPSVTPVEQALSDVWMRVWMEDGLKSEEYLDRGTVLEAEMSARVRLDEA